MQASKINFVSSPKGAHTFLGGKPHSFGELKLPLSQTTLIPRRRSKNTKQTLSFRSFIAIFAVNS